MLSSLSGPASALPLANPRVPISASASTSGIHMVRQAVAVERPVHRVLVPARVATAGLLEQRLVAVDLHRVHAQQLGGHAREPLGQDEAGHPGVEAPEVHHLEEGLAVGVALLERPMLRTQPVDSSPDHLPVRRRLRGAGDPS